MPAAGRQPANLEGAGTAQAAAMLPTFVSAHGGGLGAVTPAYRRGQPLTIWQNSRAVCSVS